MMIRIQRLGSDDASIVGLLRSNRVSGAGSKMCRDGIS